jgi:pyruvate kinase
VESLDVLARQLDGLLDDLAAAEADRAAATAPVSPEHRVGAANLVRYTALRQQDLRDLQNDLLDIGATSLATTEADVRAKIRAARNVVGALAGEVAPWDIEAINAAIDQGDEVLEYNVQQTLGPLREGGTTRIMVTLPTEAAHDPGLVEAAVAAGMDIARINCAHDDPQAWAAMAAHVRAAAAAAGRPVLVSMDVPGPKLRTGPIADGPPVGRARVTRNDIGAVIAPARIWLTDAAAPTEAPVAPPPAKRPTLVVPVDVGWLAQRSVGDEVALIDARGRKRRFTVMAVTEDGILAEGERNAFIADGTEVWSGEYTTVVSGMPPVRQRLSLHPGDALVLTTDLTPVDPPGDGEVARIGCTLPEAVAAMQVGDTVLIDDGAILAQVSAESGDEVSLTVQHTKPGGQRLGAEKGINLPDTDLPLPALTQEDEDLLPFIAQHADLVAVSFIRHGDDVAHILAALAAAGGADLGLILKIETRQGFEHLPSILLAGMRHPKLGVMIARGDLAVEVGFERLSEVPRQILALCEAGHIPTIWATQVLESLAKTGQPSRAEITDAAAGQRADCVMLNKGPHIVHAIETLDNIVNRMAEVQVKSRTLMRRIRSWDEQ